MSFAVKSRISSDMFHSNRQLFSPRNIFSENSCLLVNLPKRSHNSDYRLSLTQYSQSESIKSVKFIEKSDLRNLWSRFWQSCFSEKTKYLLHQITRKTGHIGLWQKLCSKNYFNQRQHHIRWRSCDSKERCRKIPRYFFLNISFDCELIFLWKLCGPDL